MEESSWEKEKQKGLEKEKPRGGEMEYNKGDRESGVDTGAGWKVLV